MYICQQYEGGGYPLPSFNNSAAALALITLIFPLLRYTRLCIVRFHRINLCCKCEHSPQNIIKQEYFNICTHVLDTQLYAVYCTPLLQCSIVWSLHPVHFILLSLDILHCYRFNTTQILQTVSELSTEACLKVFNCMVTSSSSLYFVKFGYIALLSF